MEHTSATSETMQRIDDTLNELQKTLRCGFDALRKEIEKAETNPDANQR